MVIESVGDSLREFGMSSDDKKMVLILNQACSNGRIGKAIDQSCGSADSSRAPDLYDCACVACSMVVTDPYK